MNHEEELKKLRKKTDTHKRYHPTKFATLICCCSQRHRLLDVSEPCRLAFHCSNVGMIENSNLTREYIDIMESNMKIYWNKMFGLGFVASRWCCLDDKDHSRSYVFRI